MSNVSIFEKKWLDLVFEGKNQKYGAYQLRQESSKTTFIAFLFGITFLIGGTLILSSFATKSSDEIIISVVLPPSIKPPVISADEIKPKVEVPKTKTAAVKTPEDTKRYKVVSTEQAIIPVTNTVENPTPNVPTSPTGGTGTSEGPSTGTAGPSVIVVNPPTTNNPVNSKELDRQPSFPGGIKNFYQYVGTNFDKENLEEGETIKVKVSFVIEKNGTMTDIEVIEKTNESVDKEAVRVLKSLKTKWTPGYKDGAPVRTRYTLPITVML
jgi:protein TonB